MDVVTVAAGGVAFAGFVFVVAGVEGFLVGRDIVGDDAEAWFVGSLAVFLGGFPQIEVPRALPRFSARQHPLGDGGLYFYILGVDDLVIFFSTIIELHLLARGHVLDRFLFIELLLFVFG